MVALAAILAAACEAARAPSARSGDAGEAVPDAAGAGDFDWLERRSATALFYPDAVLSDGSRLFFDESNLDGARILSADKASRAVTDLGASGDNVQTNSLALDDESFYTVDANAVRWAPKAGGSERSIVLGVNIRRASILVDSRFTYVAEHGCKSIRSIAKTDLSVRVTDVAEVQGDQGGSTALAQDGEALYCSGAGYRVIVRMNKSDGRYSLVASGDSVAYVATSSAGTDFGGIALSSEAVYWVVNQSGAAVGQALVGMPKAGGAVETLAELDVNGKNRVLRYDATRDTLYWVSGRSRRGAVIAYRVQDAALTVLASERPVRGGLDADADHLYWSEDGGIMRLATR